MVVDLTFIGGKTQNLFNGSALSLYMSLYLGMKTRFWRNSQLPVNHGQAISSLREVFGSPNSSTAPQFIERYQKPRLFFFFIFLTSVPEIVSSVENSMHTNGDYFENFSPKIRKKTTFFCTKIFLLFPIFPDDAFNWTNF